MHITTVRRALKRAGVFILFVAGGSSALAAPPSAGNILQQTKSPRVMPAAPEQMLTLPEPGEQSGHASAEIAVQRIDIVGNTLIATSTLAPLVQGVQGRTVSLGQLRRVAVGITRIYRRHGYTLAYAYIPAQKVKDGVVQIAVVEPRYDQIIVGGKSRLKPAQAKRTLGLDAGAPIAQGPLERGLLLLNRTPGVRVAGTLVPGAKPGTSRLETRLSDTPRVRASVAADGFGSATTGRSRSRLDVDLDNPLGYGSQLSFNGLTTQGGLLHAAGFDLRSPDIGGGLRLDLYGSRTNYQLGGSFAGLDESGSASQAGLGLSYPVILEPGRLLQARFDILHSKFRQKSVSIGLDDRSHVNLARITLDGAIAEASGGVNTGGISFSRGRLGLDSTDARASDAAGPNAQGRFWIVQAELQHSQPLAHEFHLQVALSGQLASRNLNDSEKFYAGGYYGVMSYPVGQAGGDGGALLRIELGHALPLSAQGALEAHVLAQAAWIRVNHTAYAAVSSPDQIHLGGLGAGLDYRWSNRLAARLDYVRRVGIVPSTLRAHGGELWASLRFDF